MALKKNLLFYLMQIRDTNLSITIEQTVDNVEGSLRGGSSYGIYSRFSSCPEFLKETVIKVLASKVVIQIRFNFSEANHVNFMNMNHRLTSIGFNLKRFGRVR
jgi:hypothetical protein